MNPMNTGVKLICSVAVFVAAAWIAPTGAAALNLTHTFDTTGQGWEFDDDGTEGPATWLGGTGNPPGSIRGEDALSDGLDPRALFIAPAAFQGNYTPSVGGSISFDLASESEVSTERTIRLALVDTDPLFPEGLVRQFIPVESMGDFHTYTVQLTPGAWEFCPFNDPTPCPVPTAAEFAGVMADVDRVRLIVDIVDDDSERYILDNFAVTEPAATPAAAATTPSPTTPLPSLPGTAPAKCPKGKKLVVKKGKRKCKKRRKK